MYNDHVTVFSIDFYDREVKGEKNNIIYTATNKYNIVHDYSPLKYANEIGIV